MGYFSIRCCSPELRKLLLIVMNVLIGAWAVVHLGYAGSFSIVKQKTLETLALVASTPSIQAEIKQLLVLSDGPMAYYAVAGSVSLLISIFMILVVFQIVGKENRVFYFKLIACLLISNFLLEFGAVIYSTIMMSFYALKYDAEINMSQDTIDANPMQLAKDYYNGVRNFYRLTQAEVIMVWICVLPSTAVMILALIEQFFKNEEPQEPTKIAPQRLPTQEKSKVYQKHDKQVESFGVESFGAPNKSQESILTKK